MKKFSNTLKMAILTATVPFGMLASTSASAELSASATIASSYLWRGFELGSGTPAISADLVYSNGGFYAGTWVSSGDTTGGTEYDLFAGYGGSIGESISYDISYISYIYPTGDYAETEGPGDFAEAILNVGLGPISLTYKENVAGDTSFPSDTLSPGDDGELGGPGYALPSDYSYFSIDTSAGDFSFTLGFHDGAANDSTHFDVTYGATENLAFTFSTIVDSDDSSSDPEPTVVASYSIPLM
ncbi:TorF family putative porin [bacterium]|nr:TorF family putative porin [bacterium]